MRLNRLNAGWCEKGLMLTNKPNPDSIIRWLTNRADFDAIGDPIGVEQRFIALTVNGTRQMPDSTRRSVPAEMWRRRMSGPNFRKNLRCASDP
jgi:hypothetical protein